MRDILYKLSFITAACILSHNFLAAQDIYGKISGTVLFSNNKPAAGAVLALKKSKRQVSTDHNGHYMIRAVRPGDYLLKLSAAGNHDSEKAVIVSAGKTSVVDFILAEKTAMLNEVIITGGRTLNNRTVTFGKSGIKPMDLPQSTGVVTGQVIKDQQVNHLAEAVRNVSGVSLTQTRGGVGETFSARGYSIGIGGGAGSVFQNGALVNSAGFPDASTLESVEFLKGSSALLYGNVSGGLVINMITKKPKFENGGEISMRYGSDNDYKPMIDLYGPVNNDIAFRTVATYENSGSYRNGVKTDRAYINPSLLYDIGKHTNVILEGDFLKSNLTPDWGIGSLNNGRAIPIAAPRSQFINTAWAYSHMKQYTGSLTINHQIDSSWKLNFISSAQGTNIDSYGSSLPNNVSASGEWSRGLARATTHEGDYTAQLNLTGKFNTGNISHRLLIGSDVAKVVNVSNGFSINGQNISSYIYDKINTINPAKYAQRNDIPNAVDTARVTAPVYRFGAYVQDLVGLSDHFKILGGVRWSWQRTSQTTVSYLQKGTTGSGTALTRYDRAFSPKAAFIYQPATTSSVYVSYSSGFIVNTGTDAGTGQGLRPSTLDQYEAGLKNELFDGAISANLSVYRIVNNNLAVVAPYKADGTVNSDNTLKTFSGQTTSDGVEVDITGSLNNNFYFIAGWSYNNARYAKTSGLKGSYIEGERLVINPKNTANGSLFYTFTNPGLQGFKVGASAFYTGSRLAGYNNTVGQAQPYSRLLPVGGFGTLDVSAGYCHKRISILAEISNVTSTLNYLVHDNYSITPIAPRQFLTTMTYKF